MLTTALQSILLASGGLFSVGSITIVILLLLSDQGWRTGVAYVVGYTGMYTLIGVGVVLVGANVAQNGSGESGNFSSILVMVLGGVLIWLGLRNWRKPVPAADEPVQPPRLFAMLDGITPLKALGFGALVSVVNFKNLAIFLSAISVLLTSDLSTVSKLLIVPFDVLAFCLAVILPVLIYISFPAQANDRLNRFKRSLETHSRAIGIWAPLAFGLIFILRGASGLL
ncbi:MAG: GAP family protein [Caldilineaceae bacterium]|nr:GAP family protein [Caldilineaceae bacterium]